MIYVDPGVHACGVAYFADAKLCWARYVAVGDDLRLDVGGQPLVIEMPRIYPGSGQRKGDLNDLLNLAAIVGRCEAWNAGTVKRVFPAQWKGQVPKKIMTARILSKLSWEEVARIERVGYKDHNTIDAIGLGLWHLGRL